MRGAKVEVRCERCGTPFMARVSDRNRGWGRFCSKSCKAVEQSRRTGYAGPSDDPNEPFSMTPADLAMGGYGDADENTPFGDGKW